MFSPNYMQGNPWYWSVATNPTFVFSSASATYVALTDITYLSWVADGGLATPIATESQLASVIASMDPSIVPQFQTGLVAYAYRKQAALSAGGVTVDAAASLTTNGTTASGNATLHFASVPSWVVAGLPIADITTPSVIAGGTTVLSTTGTTVVMSANASGAGVGATDVIHISLPIFCGTDTNSKSNLNGLFLLASVNPAMTVNWVNGPTSILLTAAQITAAATAVGIFVQATFTTLSTVLAGIAGSTITTKAQIDAAAWPATS